VTGTRRDPDGLVRLADEVGRLDRPVLVHALTGFVDAGGAVQLTADHLLSSLPHRDVATFDVDVLHDYRARRPPMVFVEDHWESVDAPSLTVKAVTDPSGKEFLLMVGPEPDSHWERFVGAVAWLVGELDVSLTVGLTAIPMGIPHTRPVRLTAHATRAELVSGYTPWVGTVVVPGSAGNLLEFRFGERGLDAMGLVAGVPHYLVQVPYPLASVALLEGLARAGGLALPDADLREAAEQTRIAVDGQLSDSSEGAALVESLEQQYDAGLATSELPTADELGAELERFLANQPRPDDPRG
jgi:predicted ATP-grasp superfamily ATP-dependent carboligase